jgi:hypothetical protein
VIKPSNLMTTKDKVEFLFKEKDIVRQEILLYLKTIFSSLFSFVTIFVVFVGFYFGQSKNEFLNANSPTIIFIVEQIEFVIFLFNFSQQSVLNVLAGYCQVLEEKINLIAKEKLCFWESIAIKEYLLTPKSAQYYLLIILNIFYLTSYVYLGILLFNAPNSIGYVIVQIIEILVVMPFCILILKDKKRSYKFLMSRLNVESANEA